jgi:crotonobetainyl-CoA:carnitine CoA-transferase CaiB-like acyl-CoA transferase
MITVDLTTDQGREVILDLVRWADVVAESFSPKAMKAFGLDYETLRQIKPELIMLSTCLMGQTGPLAQFAGYGNLAAAIAGFYEITGWPDREPAGPFGAYTDYIAPRFNAVAVLAALDHLRRTGTGQHIDLAQAEAAMHFLTPALLDYTANGNIQARVGNADADFAPNGVYATRGDDEYIAIACETNAQWDALCTVVPGLADVGDGLSEVAGRLAAQAELDSQLEKFAAQSDRWELEKRLQAAGVPASVVQNSPELVGDPQLAHRGHFVTLPHHEGGETVIEGSRLRMSRSQPTMDSSAPTFSRDQMYVLTDILGYDDERVGELLVAGVFE